MYGFIDSSDWYMGLLFHWKPYFGGLQELIWVTLGSILQGLGGILEKFEAAGSHGGDLGRS